MTAGSVVQMRPPAAFVSRGGEKLAAGLDAWKIDCSGTRLIDAGSSTGGFTDCLLQRGAALVYAVDVGEGQLDWKLRQDARVRAMERINIMSLEPGDFDPRPGLRRRRPVVPLPPGSRAAYPGPGRRGVGCLPGQAPIRAAQDPGADFHGVVRGHTALDAIVRDLVERLDAEGVVVEKGIPSPIAGRKGNREYLFLMRLAGGAAPPVAGPSDVAVGAVAWTTRSTGDGDECRRGDRARAEHGP